MDVYSVHLPPAHKLVVVAARLEPSPIWHGVSPRPTSVSHILAAHHHFSTSDMPSNVTGCYVMQASMVEPCHVRVHLIRRMHGKGRGRDVRGEEADVVLMRY
jgi:hypothetical protein